MAELDAIGLRQLSEEGYVLIRNLLNVEADLKPLMLEYEELLDALARGWYRAGMLSSSYEELPFAERLIAICREPNAPPVFRHLEVSLPSTPFAVVTEESPVHCGPAVFGLITSPRLLDAVEAVLGSEVIATPRQHVRFKLPARIARRHNPYRFSHTMSHIYQDVQWHQDLQTQMPCSDDSTILTAWIPVTEASLENGTLAVVPRSHRSPMLPLLVDPKPFDEKQVVIEASPGDALFFFSRTIHRGLRNRSNRLRWSIDFRYMPAGQRSTHDWLPHLTVRSLRYPASVVTDATEWTRMWKEARHELARRGEPLPGRREYATLVAQTLIERWSAEWGISTDVGDSK